MSLTVSAWCRGTHRTTGAAQAVRVQFLADEYSVNEEFGLRSTASGLYRTTYGEWGESVGSKTTDAAGKKISSIPSSGLNSDRDGYEVPDEALEYPDGELPELPD